MKNFFKRHKADTTSNVNSEDVISEMFTPAAPQPCNISEEVVDSRSVENIDDLIYEVNTKLEFGQIEYDEAVSSIDYIRGKIESGTELLSDTTFNDYLLLVEKIKSMEVDNKITAFSEFLAGFLDNPNLSDIGDSMRESLMTHLHEGSLSEMQLSTCLELFDNYEGLKQIITAESTHEDCSFEKSVELPMPQVSLLPTFSSWKDYVFIQKSIFLSELLASIEARDLNALENILSSTSNIDKSLKLIDDESRHQLLSLITNVLWIFELMPIQSLTPLQISITWCKSIYKSFIVETFNEHEVFIEENNTPPDCYKVFNTFVNEASTKPDLLSRYFSLWSAYSGDNACKTLKSELDVSSHSCDIPITPDEIVQAIKLPQVSQPHIVSVDKPDDEIDKKLAIAIEHHKMRIFSQNFKIWTAFVSNVKYLNNEYVPRYLTDIPKLRQISNENESILTSTNKSLIHEVLSLNEVQVSVKNQLNKLRADGMTPRSFRAVAHHVSKSIHCLLNSRNYSDCGKVYLDLLSTIWRHYRLKYMSTVFWRDFQRSRSIIENTLQSDTCDILTELNGNLTIDHDEICRRYIKLHREITNYSLNYFDRNPPQLPCYIYCRLRVYCAIFKYNSDPRGYLKILTFSTKALSRWCDILNISDELVDFSEKLICIEFRKYYLYRSILSKFKRHHDRINSIIQDVNDLCDLLLSNIRDQENVDDYKIQSLSIRLYEIIESAFFEMNIDVIARSPKCKRCLEELRTHEDSRREGHFQRPEESLKSSVLDATTWAV